ncbi:MAG: DUF11 domain-containing protein [Chloroflexi bacterium]|nr:DUF11 domain-containing protein [Chloroflexota bacterium]
MKNWKNFPRVVLFLVLLTSMLAGISLPAQEEAVSAAPMRQAATDVVISEFRTRGPNGAGDEFIEIYNPTNSIIPLAGLQLRRSSGCGVMTYNIHTFGAVNLQPGQYYLVASPSYSVGSVTPDVTLATNMTIADDGGIAITDAVDVPIDEVGMCAGTEYQEGGILTPLSATVVDSYERLSGGALDSCQDMGDNSSDFQLIDPSNPQNSATPRRLCGGNADLRLTHAASTLTPAVSSDVTFTITIYNDGTGDAREVEVRDILPSGLTFVSSTATQGSYSNLTSIWTVGTLTTGSNAILTLVANVATGGAKINTAEVWSSYDQDPDSTPGNGAVEDDLASVTVTPPATGFADVSVVQIVNNSTPNINDNIVFTITVSNAGADIATGVVINDDLPAGLTYISDNGGGAYNNTTGEWTIPSLAPGSSTILRITARVANAGAKTNTASVQSLGQTDPDLSDNSSSVTVTPGGGIADLSLTQSYAKSSPGTAGYVVLTITVTNNGPYNATNIVVMDELPEGLNFVSYTSDGGGTYNKDTGLWSAGSIPNGTGNTRSLRITARVDASGSRTNWAEIWSADQSDPDSTPGDGSTTQDDDASVDVEFSDLSITKIMDNVTPTVGTDVVFTIRVTNSGPDTADNVVVKDKLPASYTYLSHTGGETYDPVTGYWTVGTLNSGTTRTLNITATVASTASSLVNWAEVWSVAQVDIDSVPGDSSQSSDDDASAPAADLRIDQVVSNTYPGLNTNFTYTITVTNDGTVGTTGVQVRDKLPSGVVFKSYTSTVPVSGMTGTYSTSTYLWEVGTLATGQSQSLTITVQITSSGVRTNLAEVWRSNLPDPDSTPRNNSTAEDDDATTVVSFRPILINEVAWAGTSSSLLDDQWIELYNPSSVAVNITGWTLTTNDGSPNIILNGTIASGGYFLLEGENNSTVSDVAANQIFSILTGSLSTSGEILTLRDANGNVIDTANGNGGKWPKGGGTNYASMERQKNTAESDSVWVTNAGGTRNGLNANGGKIYGTPGKKNSTGSAAPTPIPTPTVARPTAVPIVRPVMNEFLARPGFDWNQDGEVDVFDEFIEVKNIGIVDVNMTGWTLELDTVSNSTTFEIPTLILKPGQRAVFYGLQTNILLSDGGGTVRLSNPSGKIYDAYTYPVVKVEDQSVCRLPDGNGQWYEDCVPTPNLTNTREGEIPSMPEGEAFESPVCDLPDTLPADFLFAECRGYGAGIWHSFYWDQYGWQGDQYAPENLSKWESFVE